MNFKVPYFKHKKIFTATVLLCLSLSTGISIGCFTNHVFSENAKFEKYTEQIFEKEVSSNTLTLHYSLAHPEKQGIQTTPTLGTVEIDPGNIQQTCQEYEHTLKEFSYSKLSRQNQITLDTLLLTFHHQSSIKNFYLLEEYLSPSLGIQAQLPVLLAEYAFYDKEDISDYLNLLTTVKPYFQSILKFEKKKSASGYFMSDTTLDRILEQCRTFIANPEENYMLDIFSEKLEDFGKFSAKEQEQLNTIHKELILNELIPAYESLINGLEALRETGKNNLGLAHFSNGQNYYLYLLQSETGSYVPVEKMEQRLSQQLMDDSHTISLMLREQPSLLTKLTANADLPPLDPEDILKTLQEKMNNDFPSLGEPEYQVRYIHPSMEKYLSPAFYLTPPFDTGIPNVIYINNASVRTNLELFTTLAHEGFPGHLYQTIYFREQNPPHIRSLFSTGGYVEGWATYIESYAYPYAASFLHDPAAEDLTALAWLNRSVNLAIYSLLDIGIHYRGWNEAKAASFLGSFGMRDQSAIKEVYQYIVETPANYLQYYWGYLSFLDLKAFCEQKEGDDFSLKAFHQRILEIGPVPFPVLEKYIHPDI